MKTENDSWSFYFCRVFALLKFSKTFPPALQKWIFFEFFPKKGKNLQISLSKKLNPTIDFHKCKNRYSTTDKIENPKIKNWKCTNELENPQLLQTNKDFWINFCVNFFILKILFQPQIFTLSLSRRPCKTCFSSGKF